MGQRNGYASSTETFQTRMSFRNYQRDSTLPPMPLKCVQPPICGRKFILRLVCAFCAINIDAF